MGGCVGGAALHSDKGAAASRSLAPLPVPAHLIGCARSAVALRAVRLPPSSSPPQVLAAALPSRLIGVNMWRRGRGVATASSSVNDDVAASSHCDTCTAAATGDGTSPIGALAAIGLSSVPMPPPACAVLGCCSGSGGLSGAVTAGGGCSVAVLPGLTDESYMTVAASVAGGGGM